LCTAACAGDFTRYALVERAAYAATGLGAIEIGIVLRDDFAFFEASSAAQRLLVYSVPVNRHGKTQEIVYVPSDYGAKG
jgi:long-chain acyl-CoA synthetase